MGRILKQNFAVIDDDRAYCGRLCARLNKFSKPMDLNGHWQETENQIQLKFFAVFPGKDESAESFASRVEAIVMDTSYKSEKRIERLAGFIVDLDLLFKEKTQSMRGTRLAEYARRWSPHLMRVLLTNHDPDETVESDPDLFDWPQRKDSLDQEFGQRAFVEKIVGELRNRYRTPFWAGLQSYAAKDKIVLHAMANTDSRTRRRSVSVDDFVDFFGRGYFKAEASATSNPLDSLLHPVSTIQEAEASAAKAFGSKHARFVTNGTTTSNKIVHQAICRVGSQVILDRFCHISHHYAVCMTRSWPIYLDASVDPFTEVPGQISGDQIGSLFDEILSKRGKDADLPRLVAITNSTFDGLLVKPEDVFASARAALKKHDCEHRLKEVAFLFDEAWFGFARFHPEFVEFSAMCTKNNLTVEDPWWDQNLRVYVTQSMHKTMTSFRQGSMIFMSDPVLADDWEASERDYLRQRMDNAFAAHTTTSPHAGMVASLDVGRRQIAFEGRDLLHETIMLARDFREFIDRMGKKHTTADGEPGIWTNSATDTDGNELKCDPTKITLMNSGWISGKELRSLLWSKYGIQVNKYGPNSVLCLFTIGIDAQAVSELKQHLQKMLHENKTKIASFERSKLARPDFPKKSPVYKAQIGLVEDARSAAVAGDLAKRFDPGASLVGELADNVQVLTLSSIAASAEDLFSSGFVVPYPPGYPILIPGQKVTREIITWLNDQHGREIHGLLTMGDETGIAVTGAQVT